MSRKRPAASATGRIIRCAIYTRKSTEDGLDQAFNSLDAQREACAAYIASQRHEGWTLVPAAYDDGGFSGGSMDRPGLKRLLADVEAGRVDVIVVYKVDRLTRSLADFAKIVEILDARAASFVSITQAFNTTTSMGRLTLNVLLSFAQFEREVTGERIRDKIAASKKKGLWMGGPVPLGYDVEDRKLVVNEAEADLVRYIMQRYVALRSVAELVEELARDGYRTKIQQRTSGPHKGGCAFRRGTLYHLLSNRIYRGEIVHKGTAYPGEHQAIVPQPLWDEVQARLAARGPGLVARRNSLNRSLLIGLLYDGLGRRMTPSHTARGTRRYRYYVTRDSSPEQPAWRVGAHDLEQIVKARIAALLSDRDRIARLAVGIDPRRVESIIAAAAALAVKRDLLAEATAIGISRIALLEDRVVITIDEKALLGACGLEVGNGQCGTITLDAPVARVRRGHELKLQILGDAAADSSPRVRDERLVALLSEAMAVRQMVLAAPDRSLREIAGAHGKCRKRLAKLVRLSWLAPAMVEAILDGRQPPKLTATALLGADLPIGWRDQQETLGIA
ncbi:recombinase family protein [Sphingomonas flavalba]|uniref:recombinase family protein n=1 Tax=Sphingomonas flavalba TaxID=2559804 RepID=UPI00109DF2BF|nr:recombinase family protein [Sphingomonas flavalba]